MIHLASWAWLICMHQLEGECWSATGNLCQTKMEGGALSRKQQAGADFYLLPFTFHVSEIHAELCFIFLSILGGSSKSIKVNHF